MGWHRFAQNWPGYPRCCFVVGENGHVDVPEQIALVPRRASSKNLPAVGHGPPPHRTFDHHFVGACFARPQATTARPFIPILNGHSRRAAMAAPTPYLRSSFCRGVLRTPAGDQRPPLHSLNHAVPCSGKQRSPQSLLHRKKAGAKRALLRPGVSPLAFQPLPARTAFRNCRTASLFCKAPASCRGNRIPKG